MTDTIKGEVLVPASRFLPRCDCSVKSTPPVGVKLSTWGDGFNAIVDVFCAKCQTPYEQELPQGVEGIEHGKV